MFLFFAAWQQTCCSVPVRAYSLSLSRSTIVLINFDFRVHVHVFITSSVIGKTLRNEHIGRCYGLQLLISHNVELGSYKTIPPFCSYKTMHR